ncbi:MAG TPA: ABC transporter ATP-binding protein [Anaerolineaceae bacterium]|nr:ABC transporter ATP-binding protein [Anaerolineaceae bacterium]
MSEEYFEEEEFTSTFDGKVFRRILELASPYRKWVFGFLIAVAIVSMIDSLLTFMIKLLIDRGIVPADLDTIRTILIQYGLLVVVQLGAVFAFIYLAGVIGERIRYDLRQRMFNHLQALSLSYYSRTPVGWIMARVSSDSDRVAEMITWGLLDSTWGIMNIGTALVFMTIINWRLALIVLALIPVLLVVAVYFQRRILREYRQVRKFNSKVTGSYNEMITGVRVIKALGREPETREEFGHLTGNMYNAAYRAAWLSALFLPSVQMISAFALGAIVWFGGLQAQYGGMSIGDIQAFISYVTFMMWPIQDLARVFAELQLSLASAERIFSLLDADPAIVDQPGAVDPGTIRGDIEFDHVNFAYDTDEQVLKDFNLVIRQGETIALVGPTGGGKSTIVNLVCRFYEPTSGIIRIGGQDYKTLSMHAIQSRIGMVLQTPHLFSGKIRENIRYGRLDATDEEVEQAARMVGAHAFIKNFGKGYDEEVGEGGNLLSVGQKQLISLARAILSNPEIFIMDEATSSVDTLTEALIQQGMETLMKGRTSFVIAHRLSTIKRADRILVIENGGIAEMGTHSELLRKRGKYYQLYTKQFRSQMEQAFNPFQAADTQPQQS